MSNLMDKIKKAGYWEVIIHPNEFKENLISDISQLQKIIEDNQVRLRGWYYPHLDKVVYRSGKDAITSDCDWEQGPRFEQWKYYQSGQFLHYFSIDEDYFIDAKKREEIMNSFRFNEEMGEGKEVKNFLGIIGVIYSVTEIYQFASRLAEKGLLGDTFTIKIKLGNVKNRMLFFWDVFRFLNRPYICLTEDNSINIEYNDLSKESIIKEADNLALDAAIEIFRYFNWNTVQKNIFSEDQKKFLERRI